MTHPASGRRPVLVMVGMHNSGTSLAANMVNDLGAVLGPRVLTRDSFAPGEQPRYDYWEHAAITACHDRLMEALGRHWRTSTGADPIPEAAWESDVVAPFRAELAAAVRHELAETDGLWGFKDPRTVRLLPLWRRLFDDLGLAPRYLVSTRAPGAVARSFARKAEVPLAWAEALWRRHYVESMTETEGAPRLFVDYQDWFDAPERCVDALIDFLDVGAAVDADRRAAALALIDPTVGEVKGAPPAADPLSDEIAALLRRAAAGEPVTEAARHLRDRLDAPRPGAAVPGVSWPAIDSDLADRPADPARRSVALVTMEYPGLSASGGIGTAFAALAEALREAGHFVTIVFAGFPGPGFDAAAASLAGQRVEVERLPWAGSPAATARAVLDHLRTRAFDVVHLHDWMGLGGLLALAHRHGAALPGATVVCGAHGPTAWAAEGNGAFPPGRDALEADGLERLSLSEADVVVSPSGHLMEWMEERGWPLPGRRLVTQNVYPFAVAAPPAGAPAEAPAPVTELVFFGRLEARKGVVPFIEALERLAAAGRTLPAVTLLGSNTPTVEGDALAWMRGRLEALGVTPTHLADRDRAAALDYLRGPGRLAVIPSRLENSPFTVLEAILEGLPLLAAATGGIPELVAPADRPRVLFEPTAGALATRLGEALDTPPAPARPAVAPEACRRAWQDWHERLPRRPEPAPVPPEAAPVPVAADDGDTALRDALLASTSWRLTAPLRRLAGRDHARASAAEIHGSVWWDLTAPLRLLRRLLGR